MAQEARLLDAVRAAAKPGIWAKGVTLSRADAVACESRSAAEVVMRVKVSSRPVPWTAVLYPADLAWECNCPSAVDPCEHVVAAAIIDHQPRVEGASSGPAQAHWAHVVYRFARVEGGGLTLERCFDDGGTSRPISTPLSTLLLDPALAAKLKVEQCDLAADRLFERQPPGAWSFERLERAMRLLVDARHVLLDGAPVSVSDQAVTPRVVVADQGSDVSVTVERDPSVTEVLSAGLVRCGDTLCLMGAVEVSGALLEKLPASRVVRSAELAEFSTVTLPNMSRQMNVDVQTRRIPKVDRQLKPRIVLELRQLDSGLSVLPTLVYGNPPAARVDAGRLVFLQGCVPLRDENAEARLTAHLRDRLDLMPGRRVTVSGSDQVRLVDKLQKWDGGLGGDGSAALAPGHTLTPSFHIDSHGAVHLAFNVQGKAGQEARSVDAASVLRAWQDGVGLVPIAGGGWAPLPEAWLEEHGARVAALLAARDGQGRVAAYAGPTLLAFCEALEYPVPPSLEALRPLVEGFERIPVTALPAGIEATLRDYQRTGVSWLSFLRGAGLGAILADDMGLGKTLQAICALTGPSLVVCPTSVLPNWEAELKKFRPGLKVSVFHGSGRALDEGADVVLTSYALLRLDAAALSAKQWSTVVLDEAQAIKNPDSQVARAAFGLKGTFRVALSGTPVENRLEELWSLMHFCNPGLLGGRGEFAARVVGPVAEGRAEAAAALRARIRPFVLRRLKKDVAPELPARTESVLFVKLDERERAVYDAVHAAAKADVASLLGQGANALKALEALLRLRQAACHSALVPGQAPVPSSSKVDALLDAIATATADGHKSLVFSQWTSLLDLIEPRLHAAKIRFSRLDGSTKDRGAVTREFQGDSGPPVMLLSLKAGGTGLNLTAADHVFLVDPWWNPAVEAQAADRAHRIGQERPVNVYRLVSQGTVEERILTLQDKKRAVVEAALGGAEAGAALTRDDLLELLN